MELLLIVLGLIGLDLLAMRFGHDSRDAFASMEQVQAARGATWVGHPARAARACTARPRHTLRHHVALALYRLADWLQPPAKNVISRAG